MDQSQADNSDKNQTYEEEDIDCFFLQPSSSPYNITEKVQQANLDLFSSNPPPITTKVSKVKFKDDLFSFEPDLTDEDVNSIESDQTEDPDNLTICEYKTVNISDIEEVAEDLEDDDEIIESITTDYHELETEYGVKIVEQVPKLEKIEEIQSDSTNRTTTGKRSAKRKKSGSRKSSSIHEVHCKDHCIEKLDFDLPMYIKKLEIHEKSIDLPPLQLLQRKCCDEVKQKVQKNLPNYNGLRSEYGLTSRQLESKQKQKDLLKLKEDNRRKILEEYRKRKMQQNEEVFCQWLKEISRRRQEKDRQRRIKQPYSPSVISLPNKNTGRMKERPKTANEFVPKTQIKKPRRPHTSSTCVFIEVPENILKKGINIGDLLVTNSKLLSKKLHILAVS